MFFNLKDTEVNAQSIPDHHLKATLYQKVHLSVYTQFIYYQYTVSLLSTDQVRSNQVFILLIKRRITDLQAFHCCGGVLEREGMSWWRSGIPLTQ